MPRPDAPPGGDATARPLLDALHRKAEAETQSRRTAAGAEAERIRADAETEIARHVAAATAERASALDAMQDADRAECLQRLTRETLTARAEALDRVFSAAAARIETRCAHAGLGTALKTMIADALSYLPDGPAQLRCASATIPAVQAAIATLGRDALQVREDATVPLGVLAESGDGSIVVDATFARRLVRERPRLAITLANELAGAPR